MRPITSRLLSAVLAAFLFLMGPGTALVFATEAQLEAMVNRILQANQLSESLVQRSNLESSDTLNAYTDGEKVVITSALWNQLSTQDQRAFVASHEVAHIALSHIEKTTYRRVGFSVLGNLLSRFLGGGLATTASSVGLQLIERKFSRNQEYQADELGLQMMRKAGYDPHAALDVFKTLKQASGARTPEFLSTHPIPESRMEALVKQYELRQ